MKKLLFCTMLCLGLGACGGKKTTATVGHEEPETDSVVVEVITELPPLEEGEIFQL